VSSGKADAARIHDGFDRLAITGYPVSSAETLTYDANKGPEWRWQNDSDPSPGGKMTLTPFPRFSPISP
jgi:hypothetical protein